MSVEHGGNGRLRLACDGDWCSRKFLPRRTPADAKDLRWRAVMHGWLTQPEQMKQPALPGVAAAAPSKVRDLCPECRRKA